MMLASQGPSELYKEDADIGGQGATQKMPVGVTGHDEEVLSYGNGSGHKGKWGCWKEEE